jgi:hypothetical protein
VCQADPSFLSGPSCYHLLVCYSLPCTINVGLISLFPSFDWIPLFWRCWLAALHCSLSNTNALRFSKLVYLVLQHDAFADNTIGLKRSITLPQNVCLSLSSFRNSLTLLSSPSFWACIRLLQTATSVSSSMPYPTGNRLTLSSMASYRFMLLRLEGLIWL